MPADRSVSVRFDANVAGYLAGVGKMQSSTASFAKSAAASATKHRADWDRIGKAAMVGGAAIGAGLLYAAKKYMDFEAAISNVAAVADATAQQQVQLADAALAAGQATVFSATEAAAAEAELAKAGVQVSDILGGALTGSLNLAAAGGIDLAKSAEIAGQQMNIFGMRGSDVGHIADVLTAAANKSAAGVDDLGMALAQGGLVAKQTGLSFEDTVGALAAFADNGLKSSDAGTSLKTMLQRLNPTSKEAAELMDQLGLHAYDSSGEFVGLAEYAGMLQGALGDMSAEQRNAAMATLFGSDAVRAATVLYGLGTAGVQEYVGAVNDSGAASRMAARMTDNLKGDIERLSGSLDTAFIKAGSGGNDGLRSLTQMLDGLVNQFNELPKSTQSFIVQAAALSSAALLIGGGVATLTGKVLTLKASMDAAGLSAGRMGGALRGLGAAAVVGATAAIADNLVKIMAQAKIADASVESLAGSLAGLTKSGPLSGGVADLFRRQGGLFSSTEKVVTTTDAVQRFAQVANDALGDSLYSKFVRFQDMGEATGQLEKYISSLDSALAQMVTSGSADQAARSLEALLSGIEDQAVVDEVRGKMVQYQAALDQVQVSGETAAEGSAAAAEGIAGAGDAAGAAADEVKDFGAALSDLNSPALDARAATRDLEQSIDDAAKAAKDAGAKQGDWRKALSASTEAGRKNQAALDAVASAAIKQIGALQQNGASQGRLQSALGTSRARLVTLATQFGMSRAEAARYADSVLKIPAAKKTSFTTPGAVQSRNAAAALDSAIRAIPASKRAQVRSAFNRGGVDAAYRALNAIDGKVATTYITTVRRERIIQERAIRNTTYGSGVGGRATGGAVFGPGTETSDSIPAMLSTGEHVLTAAEVRRAGGHDAIYRLRAGIRSGVLRFAGGGAVRGYASGGEVDWSEIFALVSDVTTRDDSLSASRDAVERRKEFERTRARLAAWRQRLRRSDTSGERAEARRMIAALTAEYRRRRTAASTAQRVSDLAYAEYRRDSAPMVDRAIRASATRNTVTKGFLDNIDKLVRMGFKPLAMELLNQGGDEAEEIAAQAVRSASKAKTLQTAFATSASLDARADRMRAVLSGDLGEAGLVKARYEQVRDLSAAIRSGSGSGSVSITVQTGVGDPVAIGAEVERVLLAKRSVTGFSEVFR